MIPARPRTRTPGAQQGYVLLALLLIVTLAVVAAAALAPSIAFQIKRDREEELVHRGVQYSRAIRLFSKKTGGLPFRLQDLSSPSGIRYARKLYRDPITRGDFRLLHTADIIPSAANLNASRSPGENTSDGNPAASPETQQVAGDSNDPQPESAGPPEAATPRRGIGAPPSEAPLVLDDPTKGAVFGVASTSKSQSIREFNHKNHYNEWLFFYDPRSDRGVPMTGPTPLTLSPAPPAGQPAAGSAQPQPLDAPPAQQ